MSHTLLDHVRTVAQHDAHANVKSRLGEIDALPIPDASVNVVISDRVIHLAPDENKVFPDIARRLKPGGRVASPVGLTISRSTPPDLPTNLKSVLARSSINDLAARMNILASK